MQDSSFRDPRWLPCCRLYIFHRLRLRTSRSCPRMASVSATNLGDGELRWIRDPRSRWDPGGIWWFSAYVMDINLLLANKRYTYDDNYLFEYVLTIVWCTYIMYPYKWYAIYIHNDVPFFWTWSGYSNGSANTVSKMVPNVLPISMCVLKSYCVRVSTYSYSLLMWGIVIVIGFTYSLNSSDMCLL